MCFLEVQYKYICILAFCLQKKIPFENKYKGKVCPNKLNTNQETVPSWQVPDQCQTDGVEAGNMNQGVESKAYHGAWPVIS